ncbi:MAG: Fic family protein [Actinomycetota bacterium]
MIYLDLDDLLYVAERAVGHPVDVRDGGLLESALARPRASAFGPDSYPDLDHKVAALLHSLARNHALIDGNKRLALAATIAFHGVNGRVMRLSNAAAYDLIVAVATGEMDDVEAIAARLVTKPSATGGAQSAP